jgi:hypothetical protein
MIQTQKDKLGTRRELNKTELKLGALIFARHE